MLLLGIETSCDETALCLLDHTKVRGHVLFSQDHSASGGVIPTVAAREHLTTLPLLFTRLLKEANLSLKEIQGIGVTRGPGLAGCLLVGVLFAQGLALSLQKPLWAIHHLEAHILVARKEEATLSFPYLALLLSGGHCLIAIVHGVEKYTLLGQTYDDAAGECLDKVARALGGPYPGGPYVEERALRGDPYAVPLPIPLIKEKTCHFSFSGLKTASVRWIANNAPLSSQDKDNVCASLQRVMTESIERRLEYALDQTGLKQCVMVGGVASSSYFRQSFLSLCHKKGVEGFFPPPSSCTDNGIMVAWACYEHLSAGITPSYDFSIAPYWPLDHYHSSL